MTQTSSRFMPGSSRLVRSLSEMLDLESQTHPENFSERLSQKIDFSGSVKLSDAHGSARTIDRRIEAGLLSCSVDSEQGLSELDKCQQAFVRVRRAITQSIEWGFDPDKALGRIKLPAWDAEFLEAFSSGQLSEQEIVKASEPFAKFYKAQQSDMSAKVQGLRVHVRDVLESYSPKLAKLIVLDRALEEALSVESRKFLSSVPKLLAFYFKTTFERPVGKSGDMFSLQGGKAKSAAFLSALKSLLMAELEVRLQVVLGLIEALNEEVRSNADNVAGQTD